MKPDVQPESRLTCHADSVTIEWDGGSVSTLPNLWLRDNCDCRECRIEQTSEKRFVIADVPADLMPECVELIDDALHLRWPGGHQTLYRGEQLRSIDSRASHGVRLWPPGYLPQLFEFRDFLDDDATAGAAISDFLATGAIVLGNASSMPGTLESLAPRLGPVREVLFARIHDVRVDPRGYNVAHTALPLPPHNDFASYSWPPSVQALHMLVNDTTGGETIIVDGWAVLQKLRDDEPDLFAALCAMPVPFREFDDNNETFAIEPIVRLDVDGNISGFRFSNQLMQAIDPNHESATAFYKAYRELCVRITSTDAQVRFRLSGGQILVVAAQRVLHGRNAFAADGERHLQDAYFEFDNVKNHLTVLKRRSVTDV